MGSKQKKKVVVGELNRMNYDVKAETIVNDLIQSGYSPDDFIIGYNSKHKKNWAKDLSKAEMLGDKILLKLTRNGFVQSLPEYLFLKPVEGSKEEKVERMEFNKRQLTYARYFFNPVENEIFNNGVALEAFENEQIASLSFGDNKCISDFWRIDEKIKANKLDYIRFNKLMPAIHSIVGNFSATGNCLAFLLETSVTVKLKKKLITAKFATELDTDANNLGTSECGNTMVLGNTMDETVSVIVFTIGSIAEDEVVFYLENGRKHNLINCFVSYFIPVQYETEFVINVASSGSGFSLNDSYLGFNSTFNL
ncbi:MAG: hypothetical protein ACOYN4_01695 [Bacteroidales bacterium]